MKMKYIVLYNITLLLPCHVYQDMNLGPPKYEAGVSVSRFVPWKYLPKWQNFNSAKATHTRMHIHMRTHKMNNLNFIYEMSQIDLVLD
jgi:hypothetical protein